MSKGLILITGASGFIGSHVLDVSLKAGYDVRLTVRKDTQIKELKNLFPTHTSQIDFVVVPDITASDAFDGTMNGVHYVFHLASPMPGKGEDVRKDYVDPAVKGTESLLQAANAAPSIKRVTVLASILSLMPMGGMAMTDLDIKENSDKQNPVNLDMEFPPGFDGHGLKYQASKVLAHQASSEFIKTQNPHFTLITLHPTFVLGPSLVQKSAEDVTGVVMMFMYSLPSEKPLFPSTIVDVRDVAEATLATINANVERKGDEFIISGAKTTWDDIAAYVKVAYPQAETKLQPPFEKPLVASASKAERVLGVKWRSMQEMVSSVLDQQLALRKKSKV